MLVVRYKNDRFHLISWIRCEGALGLICLGTVSVWAQTQDLATTDDGSKLYFSSTLRLKGTDEYTNGKIFEYANGSYSLIGQVIPSTTLADGSIFQFAYRMPNVNGDGSILAYDGTASCTGGPLCQGSFTTVGYIIGAQLPEAGVYPGSLRISHNGRYAIRFGGVRSIIPQYASLYDFQSRKFVLNQDGGDLLTYGAVICTVPGDGRQSLADDGTVLTDQGLWRNGQIKDPGVSVGGITSRLSSDGSVVVDEFAVSSQCYGDFAFGYCEYNNILVAYNVSAGTEVGLAKGPTYQQNHYAQPLPSFFPTLSNDGRFVLYRGGLGPQLIVSTTDGTVQRQLTNDPLGIAEGVLSGDAHHAYAVTQNGALLSIDVDSGQVQTLLSGGVPTVTQTMGAVVPGSLVTFMGTDLSTSVGHSRLSFNGPQPPVISSTVKSVTIQIPWEIDTTHPLTVSGANPDSPFEQAESFQPVLASPEFLGVFHADFTPLNTYNNFAKPGEILILYMTGLGPVSPPIATGQAAPPGRLSDVQFPLHCVWDGQTADIQFAGLAPGTVGVYQVNIVAPATIGGYSLTCTSVLPSGGSSDSATTTIFVATAQ